MINCPLRATFSVENRTELPQAMGRMRKLAGLFGASIGYNTRQHKLTDELHSAIDALATELTGDSCFYHAKPHGSREGA